MIALMLLWVLTQQPSDLAQRIGAAPDGEVRMTFAARPGLCDHHHRYMSGDEDIDVEYDEDECDDGPVRVVLWMSAHEPVRLHTHIGGHWRPRANVTITDLGVVSASAAADYFLGLAEQKSTHIGHDAIFPATLADSAQQVRIWPRIIAIARDNAKPTETRKNAVFWLGQAAANAAGSLDSLVTDNTVDREVRESAIFALSQRPRDEGVPILINVAKNNHDPELRRKAMFWLGQTGDPRAIELFEAILTGKN